MPKVMQNTGPGLRIKERVRSGELDPQTALNILQYADPGVNTTPKENATVRWLLRRMEEGGNNGRTSQSN